MSNTLLKYKEVISPVVDEQQVDVENNVRVTISFGTGSAHTASINVGSRFRDEAGTVYVTSETCGSLSKLFAEMAVVLGGKK